MSGRKLVTDDLEGTSTVTTRPQEGALLARATLRKRSGATTHGISPGAVVVVVFVIVGG